MTEVHQAVAEPTEALDAGTHVSAAARGSKTPELLLLLERYGLLLLLVIAVVIFSTVASSSQTFPTQANVANIVGGQVVLGVVALGFTLPLIVGKLDLSVASITGLASVGSAAAMSRFDAPLIVAIAVGILIGTTVGVINGLLVAYLNLDAIIITLAGTTIMTGLTQWYTKGLSINSGISKTLGDFGSLKWLGVPRITYMLVIVLLVVWYLVEQTPFGKYLRMIGSNPNAARLVGLSVERTIFRAFVLTGFLAGVAGVLLTARTGGANPQDGPGLLLPALAAVFLGATTIQPGRFNVVGTVLGVFVVAVVVSGLILSGVPPFVESLFNGGALLAAVFLSRGLGRGRGGGGTVGS